MTKTTLFEKINSILDEYNFELLTDEKDITSYTDYIEYKCLCGNTIKKTISQFFKKPEKICCQNRKQKIEFDKLPEEKSEDGKIWKKFETIWISEEGKAVNMYGKVMELDEKKRYYVNDKHYYASRIMAFAFKIKDYDKLDSQKFVVSFINGDNSDFTLKNLKVISKSEINQKNGKKSRQSDEFKENMIKDITYYLINIPYKIIKELPEYIIFEDGNIYNKMSGPGSKRFLTGSKSTDGYIQINTKGQSYKIHRLVCMAWHPIEGKELYEDYSKLQVNHLNGIKTDNHKDNLCWETQSGNMQHAYDTKLNKKVRAVLQFENKNGEYGKIISEYPSLAKASRETKIPEHEIREISKSKVKYLNDKKYLWKYKNEEETEEYRQKFSSKLADRN